MSLQRQALKIVRDTKNDFAVGSETTVALIMSRLTTDDEKTAIYELRAPWGIEVITVTPYEFRANPTIRQLTQLIENRTRRAMAQLTSIKLKGMQDD